MHAAVPVFILAGGKSSRFGSDKARALVDGKPLVALLAERLRTQAVSITVVADVAGKYADLNLETIADDEPGLGPIGGLKTALRVLKEPAAGGAWFLLSSCDLVGFDLQWLEALLAARTSGARAVAFKGERWEPLIALYHQSIGEDLARAIAAGELSMWKLLERVSATALPLPTNWAGSAQFNTPQELATFLKSQEKRTQR